MKTTEFKKAVNSGLKAIIEKSYVLEPIKEKAHFIKMCGGLNAIFAYAGWCEQNLEANLREDYSRKTTFTADFSIAEWCEQIEPGAVLDTTRRCFVEWHTNIEFFAALVIVLNMKSWEHFQRGNTCWSSLYADLYYLAKELYFDWFEGNKKAMDYYYDYVD